MTFRTRIALLVIAVIFASATLRAQTVSRWVQTLAGEEMGGRMSGTPDEARAAAYIVAELQKLGVAPLEGHETYLHPFPFVASQQNMGTRAILETSEGNVITPDIMPAPFSPMGKATGRIVVHSALNSRLDNIDGSVVILTDAVPPGADFVSTRPSAWAETAAAAGAKGLVFHAPPFFANGHIPSGLDERRSEQAPIPVIFAGDEFVRVASNATTATLDLRLLTTLGKAHNILGYLPATTTATDSRPIIIGAHYDHVGQGLRFAGERREGKRGPIHYGADDNASGVAAVLDITQRLTVVQRTRPVIIAFWSGEELGILGSQHFLAHPPINLDGVAYYINFDMVGRLRPEGLQFIHWPADDPLIRRGLGAATFDSGIIRIKIARDIPSDYAAFTEHNISSVAYFTGLHEQYHRPTDTPATINYQGISAIATHATTFILSTMRE